MSDEIETEVTENEDGSRSVKMSFTLSGEARPVRDDVVQLMDDTLKSLGEELMHMVDPSRLKDFDDGGPPVWSVGLVQVPGERPYTLLVTYGFSHVLSPSDYREGLSHEYSIAVPTDQPIDPWAGALLRHLARYVLSTGRDLEVGQIMPCYAPVTCIPFQPEHHGEMPETELDAIVVATDPVVPSVTTPHGEIEVRRFLGITPDERERVETWSPTGFVEEYRSIDPLLLTDLDRSSAMEVDEFAGRSAERAAAEGSDVPAFMAEFVWTIEDDELVLGFKDSQAAQQLVEGVRNRVGFDRELLVASPNGTEIGFQPGDDFRIDVDGPTLVVHGRIDQLEDLLAPIEKGAREEDEFYVGFQFS